MIVIFQILGLLLIGVPAGLLFGEAWFPALVGALVGQLLGGLTYIWWQVIHA